MDDVLRLAASQVGPLRNGNTVSKNGVVLKLEVHQPGVVKARGIDRRHRKLIVGQWTQNIGWAWSSHAYRHNHNVV